MKAKNLILMHGDKPRAGADSGGKRRRSFFRALACGSGWWAAGDWSQGHIVLFPKDDAADEILEGGSAWEGSGEGWKLGPGTWPHVWDRDRREKKQDERSGRRGMASGTECLGTLWGQGRISRERSTMSNAAGALRPKRGHGTCQIGVCWWPQREQCWESGAVCVRVWVWERVCHGREDAYSLGEQVRGKGTELWSGMAIAGTGATLPAPQHRQASRVRHSVKPGRKLKIFLPTARPGSH